MFNLKNLLYNEVPDVEAPHDKVSPLVTAAPLPQFFNNNGATKEPENVFIPKNYAPQLQISVEAQKQWQDYFIKVLSDIKTDNPIYGQFLANIDMVSETDASTPIPNKFKFAFGFMKKSGLTKEQLLAAANKAYEAVQSDRKDKFEPTQADKTNKGINANNKLIQDKKDKIAANIEENNRLNQEILQHQADIATTTEKIATRGLCYDTLATQLLAKVQEDIKCIQTYII